MILSRYRYCPVIKDIKDRLNILLISADVCNDEVGDD
jgi:hypothetical protein